MTLQQIIPAPKALFIVRRYADGSRHLRQAAAIGLTETGEGVVLDVDERGRLYAAGESEQFAQTIWE